VTPLTDYVRAKTRAAQTWIDLVKTGGLWDYKTGIRAMNCTNNQMPPQGFDSYARNSWWTIDTSSSPAKTYQYEIWANLHYGYIGRAAGYTAMELVNGAGVAQVWEAFDTLKNGASSCIDQVTRTPPDQTLTCFQNAFDGATGDLNENPKLADAPFAISTLDDLGGQDSTNFGIALWDNSVGKGRPAPTYDEFLSALHQSTLDKAFTASRAPDDGDPAEAPPVADPTSPAPPQPQPNQPGLSVTFDHDSYDGGALNSIDLTPGATSNEIVAYFRNTSASNTLYQDNVFLAAYNPDGDRPGVSMLCNRDSSHSCTPLTLITLDNRCDPGALCSFTYRVQAPGNFSGTSRQNWRVLLLHPNGTFDHWLNGPDGGVQTEYYDVVSAQVGNG
jgi:hypothetical protein